MKHIMTVTKQECDPMQYTHDKSTVEHVEKRVKNGAALLWIKQWFKTQGVNRTFQKRGNGRVIDPPAHATAETYLQLPVYGGEDWSEAFSMDLSEAYRKVGSHNKEWGLNSYHPEWGLRVIDVYSLKRHEWFSLWLRVNDDDGVEYISDNMPS